MKSLTPSLTWVLIPATLERYSLRASSSLISLVRAACGMYWVNLRVLSCTWAALTNSFLANPLVHVSHSICLSDFTQYFVLIISTSFAYLEFIFADVPGNLIPFLYRAIEHFGVSVIFNILVKAYPLQCIVEDVVPADRG